MLVYFVELKRGPGEIPGDHAVGTDFGVVAHPAQQPVGDPRRPARPGGKLGRALVGERYPEQPGRPADDDLELVRLVEVQVGGEAEPVAERSRQQPGPGSRPDQRERRDVQRDGGRARALADHHVDAEVLHGQVEHLLGGPGQAVDLVDEDHLALAERGQHRRQVTRPLDRRTAGDAQRRAELGGDDHRDRGLAQPGRAGQQHVVRRPTAPQGALQDQRQLLAHPRLADELGEPLGPQRALDNPLVRVGQRGHHPFVLVPAVLTGPAEGPVLSRHRYCLLSLRRAARSTVATSTASPSEPPTTPSSSSAAMARSASLAGQPRFTRPDCTWSRHAGARRAARGGQPSPPSPGGPSLSFISSTIRCAPFLPIPGTMVSAPRSSVETARRSASGACTASMARASLGPTPLAVCSSSKTFRSSSEEKPYKVSESSRTTSEVATCAGSPSLSVASVPGVHCTRIPTPPTSMTAPSGATPATVPRK